MAFDADRPLGPPSAQHATRSGDGAQPYERDIVAFAKVWAPYGGGSEADIFVTFGLTEDQYFTRLATLLGSSVADGLTLAQRRTIFSMCLQRLAHTHPNGRPSPPDSIAYG
jgi:hypothetical protein